MCISMRFSFIDFVPLDSADQCSYTFDSLGARISSNSNLASLFYFPSKVGQHKPLVLKIPTTMPSKLTLSSFQGTVSASSANQPKLGSTIS